MKIEYRIKPVTRYIVTRYESGDMTSLGDTSSRAAQIGNEYDTADVAYQVGYAVCAVEHQRLGWPIDDMRIQYPRDPSVPDEYIRVSGVVDKITSGDRISIADVRIHGADAQAAAKLGLAKSNPAVGLVAGTISGNKKRQPTK